MSYEEARNALKEYLRTQHNADISWITEGGEIAVSLAAKLVRRIQELERNIP